MKKTFLYDSYLFSSIKKKDGIIACIVINVIVFLYFILVCLLPQYKSSVIAVWFFCLFSVLLLIAHRKKLDTLGITSNNMIINVAALVAGSTIAFIFNIKQIALEQVALCDFIINILYYLILFFVSEELVFRGYLWPRMIKLFGKHKGTIICGILYGIMHFIPEVAYEHTEINWINIFNMISGGIIGQYIFGTIYFYSSNIFLSTIIHAIPHFNVVDKTIKGIWCSFSSII